MMDWIDKVKELNRKNLADILLPEYRFKNLIFMIGIFFVFVWLLVAAFQVGLFWNDKIYFKCPDDAVTPCENPFYLDSRLPSDVNSKEFLVAGETYGEPPGFFFKHAGMASFIIMLLAVLFNHLVYNKGYFWKEEENMVGFYKIEALTQKGRDAIKNNVSEREKLGRLQRKILDAVFAVLVAKDFSKLEFYGKTKFINKVTDRAEMAKTFKDSMINEGCVEGKDFLVEVGE